MRLIRKSLDQIQPADPAFAQLQRQYFLACEKYLDRPAADSFAPFTDASVADLMLAELRSIDQANDWRVPVAVIMPNHIHFLLEPKAADHAASLRETVRHLKGRAARRANQLLERAGAFWQRDWFDRWMRDETETAKVVDYIRLNPVKAGLVARPEDWAWRI